MKVHDLTRLGDLSADVVAAWVHHIDVWPTDRVVVDSKGHRITFAYRGTDEWAELPTSLE